MPLMRSFAAIGWAVAALLLTFLLCLLAMDLVPGLPLPSVKNVSVYYPTGADKLPVTLFLQPPTSTFVLSDDSQSPGLWKSLVRRYPDLSPESSDARAGSRSGAHLLTLQFSNHTDIMANVSAPRTLGCFDLQRKGNGGPAPDAPFDLRPRETLTRLYTLTPRTGSSSCLGPQSLVIDYSWTLKPPPPARRSRGTGSRRSRRKATPPKALPVSSGEQSISTSPITVITPIRRISERFFHIIGLIIIPIMAGVLTFVFQRMSDNRADNQKRSEMKLDVWKINLPIMVGQMKVHYIPINRSLRTILDSITRFQTEFAAASGPKPVPTKVFAAIVIARQKFSGLTRKEGAFYFRNIYGEEICATFFRHFWEDCFDAMGRSAFNATAQTFIRTDSDETVLARLNAGTDPQLTALEAAFCIAYPTPGSLGRLELLLSVLEATIDFECNRVMYPEWNEDPPLFKKKDFSQCFENLDEKETSDLQRLYLESIPKECTVPYDKRGRRYRAFLRNAWRSALGYRWRSALAD